MNNRNIKKIHKSGFALLISIITTGMLLVVSFVIVNVALKQLVIAYADQESQSAFYVADSGIECATFWDIKNPANPSISAFATSTAGSVTCNSQTVTSGSQTIPNSGQPSLVGGGGVANPMSIFKIDFASGCAVVRVTKQSNGVTTIDSRGYNTCDISSARRFERGIIVTY